MKQHPADALADDLNQWIDDVAGHLAERILGGPLSPPTAPMPEAERLRYFANQFFNADGSPNQGGRDAVMQKYGPQAFETIARALAKRHGQLHEDVTGEELPEPDRTVPAASGVAPQPPAVGALMAGLGG